MTVNGQPVGKLAFDGTSQNAARDVVLSKWRGVDIREGDNELVASVLDAAGIRRASLVGHSLGSLTALGTTLFDGIYRAMLSVASL